jgi:adenylate cyclase class 2
MAVEIELKAWVDDFSAAQKTLSNLCVYKAAYTKSDIYWFPQKGAAFPASGLRVRKEKTEGAPAKTLVTYKTKERRSGIEINDEKEFTVSEAGVFEELLEALGFEAGKSKKKSGFSFDYHGITAELSCVEGLGFFVELEIIADSGDTATVENSRRRLLNLLALIGISEDKIEARYYTELLENRSRRAVSC